MHEIESQQTQTRSTKEQQAEPSKKEHEAATLSGGMGAFLAQNGSTKPQVGFRVWAPNAQAVSVIGDFNDWSPTANPLTSEEGGYWAGLVPEAKVGDEYKFFLQTALGDLHDLSGARVFNGSMVSG